MNKIVLLIVCLILTATYAENPNWYPENTEEIAMKCQEEYHLQIDFDKDHQFVDNAETHNLFLCKAKGINIYSEDNGLNVDRLISFYKRDSNCRKPLVQDCVDKYKDLDSAGKMIFKVIQCIAKKEQELKDDKTGC